MAIRKEERREGKVIARRVKDDGEAAGTRSRYRSYIYGKEKEREIPQNQRGNKPIGSSREESQPPIHRDWIEREAGEASERLSCWGAGK